jgi:hypothetical protein
MKQTLVLSWEQDESLPTFVDIGHNLKPENLFVCESELLMNMTDYYVIHKKLMHGEKDIDIFVTHSNKKLIRGFLYCNNKEYVINEHKTYSSLQIGKWSYDNIAVARLSENPLA